MGFFKKLHDKVTKPDAIVELKLANCTVALGENLEGSICVSSKDDFDVTEVRCEIQCTEEAKVLRSQYDPVTKRNELREVQEIQTLFSAKPAFSSATHICNGDSRTFPFCINIPAGGRPTYQAIQDNVSWTIKGVLAIDGRPDATSHIAGIQVIQLPAQSSVVGETVVKEVVREIVKIPCNYCHTLFDQLETTCPNCGAKRTV